MRGSLSPSPRWKPVPLLRAPTARGGLLRLLGLQRGEQTRPLIRAQAGDALLGPDERQQAVADADLPDVQVERAYTMARAMMERGIFERKQGRLKNAYLLTKGGDY